MSQTVSPLDKLKRGSQRFRRLEAVATFKPELQGCCPSAGRSRISLTSLIKEDRLRAISGIGSAIAQIIKQLYRSVTSYPTHGPKTVPLIIETRRIFWLRASRPRRQLEDIPKLGATQGCQAFIKATNVKKILQDFGKCLSRFDLTGRSKFWHCACTSCPRLNQCV